MHFRTFDHYYDKDEREIVVYKKNINADLEKDIFCFICYEETSYFNNRIVKLLNQTQYIKKCACNGNIHIKCLDKWCETSNSCPICRKTLFKQVSFKCVFFNHIYVLGRLNNNYNNYLNNNFGFPLLVRMMLFIYFVYFASCSVFFP
jgi:hypothetical protein